MNQCINEKKLIINLDYAFITINKNSFLDFYHLAIMIGPNLKKSRYNHTGFLAVRR